MIRRRRHLTGIFAVAIVVAATLLPAEDASAAYYQCGAFGSRWTGWTSRDSQRTQPPSGIEGSSAYIITNYWGAVCGTDHDPNYNFIMSYDMVYDATNKYYSQAGTYWGYGQPCVYTFVEQSRNGVHQRKLIRCTDQGERNSYRNLMEGNPYHIASYINGIAYMVSSYNPFYGWTYPFDIQFMGEVKYLQSDVFGVPSAKQNFTAMGVQRFDNDQLVTTCGYVYLAHYHDIPGRYATDAVSCSHVRTWTQDV